MSDTTTTTTALIINNTPQVLDLWGVRLGAREDTEFGQSFREVRDEDGTLTLIPDKGEIRVNAAMIADWMAAEKRAKVPEGSFRDALRGLKKKGQIRIYDDAGLLGV